METEHVCREFVARVGGEDRNHGAQTDALVTDIVRALNACTRAHIDAATQSILAFATTSERALTLAHFLVQLTASCVKDSTRRVDTTKPGYAHAGLGKIVHGKVQQPPHPAFMRLHVVFVVSDVLYAIQSHHDDDDLPPSLQSLAHDLKRFAPLLVSRVAGTDGTPSELGEAVASQLNVCLAIWRETRLLPSADIDELARRSATSLSGSASGKAHVEAITAEASQLARELAREHTEANWALPQRHGFPGDPTGPWHELPAANGLYMKRTRGYPLKSYAFPPGGFQLRDAEKPPDPQLKADVQKLQSEMLHAFDEWTDPAAVQDVDAMGNIIWKDPSRPTRNYWGLSLESMDVMRDLNRRFATSPVGYADVPLAPPQLAPTVPPPPPVAIDAAAGRSMVPGNFSGVVRDDRGGGFGRGGRHPRGRMGEWRGGGPYMGSRKPDWRSE